MQFWYVYKCYFLKLASLAQKICTYYAFRQSEIRVRLVPSNMLRPSSEFLTGRPQGCASLWILFVICVSCHTVLYVPCSHMVTCWERADLLAFLYVMFLCFVTFPYGVLRKVWYLILSIPDLCLLLTLV